MTLTAMSPAAADLLQDAKAKLAAGTLTDADLEQLARAGRGERGTASLPGALRQRLLYLHAAHPTIRSEVLSAALHEPRRDGPAPQLDPLAPPCPYATVFDAILDGWRVIHFPSQQAPFDDREIDLVGYEFILEKLEAARD